MMSLLKADGGTVELYDPPTPSSAATLCNFMYVPQGNSLMSGTIRQNLHLADPDASDETLMEVLDVAAAEFVRELPDGLDTVCSEVGGGLSEGQAQRIAIARALLRPGGILVLDEATSALDAETEERLLKNLAARCEGTKTVICITHRPAFLNLGKIFVLSL
jgi:ABC-type multidrug transport system fused ATPase/permease subunit